MLLDANRHVVEALRDELLERDELVGEEITNVIAEALAEGGARRHRVTPERLRAGPGYPRPAVTSPATRPRRGRRRPQAAPRRLAPHPPDDPPATCVGRRAASRPGSCGPRPSSTVPLLAAAAIDDGMRTGDRRQGRRSSRSSWCASAWCRPSRPGFRRYSAFRIALRTETDLRQRLFAHLQRLHFAFHDQAQTGQLMARANTDIQQVETVVILIPLTVGELFTIGGVLVIMLLKNAGARAARARRAAVPQHRGDALLAAASRR